jgi:hypothetical protein
LKVIELKKSYIFDSKSANMSKTYIEILGPVLGRVLDQHQWVCEEKTRPTYETAIEVARENNKIIQAYPLPEGLILKLVVDHKCVRQARVKNNARGSIDHYSVSNVLKMFGFKKCELKDGTALLVQFFQTVQNMVVDGPTVIMYNSDKKECRFKILGGIWKPGKSKVRIWCDQFDKELLLEGPEAKDLTKSYIFSEPQ